MVRVAFNLIYNCKMYNYFCLLDGAHFTKLARQAVSISISQIYLLDSLDVLGAYSDNTWVCPKKLLITNT